MGERIANPTPNETETEEVVDGAAEAPREPINRQRKGDALADAFEKAEAEVEDDAAPKKPKKAKAKSAADDDDEAGEGAEKPGKSEKAAKKPANSKATDPDDEPDDDDADLADAKAVKAKPKAKETEVSPQKPTKAEQDAAAGEQKKTTQPLQAKAYWAKEKREAFTYQPRQVQEAWLAEAPVPYGHWSGEQKAAFAKLPREAQEGLLVQAQEIERGYNQKFETLANERKLAEGIRNAVPANMRETMKQRGLDEVGVFTTLLRYQQQAMQDPVGYVRQFIAMNKIDPRLVFGAQPQPGTNHEAGQQTHQNGPQPQADFRSHPVVAAMMAQINALKQTIEGDRQQREDDDDRRRSDEMSRVLAETDEGGNSRYPFIRLLAVPMAEIIESDPERYRSMDVKEQIADAYRRAQEQFPELTPPQPKVTLPLPVDEPEEEETEADREAEAEKLKKASTKKGKTPQSAPSVGGDPFARAFQRAERQVGHR